LTLDCSGKPGKEKAVNYRRDTEGFEGEREKVLGGTYGNRTKQNIACSDM
jgi:hypothetical protein